jgi:hypothetical protein
MVDLQNVKRSSDVLAGVEIWRILRVIMAELGSVCLPQTTKELESILHYPRTFSLLHNRVAKTAFMRASHTIPEAL